MKRTAKGPVGRPGKSIDIIMEKMVSPVSSMPLWRWVLELVGGLFLFILLYGVAQGSSWIESLPLSIVVMLLSSAAIPALFLVWSRLFEKAFPIDVLSCRPMCNLVSGMLIGFLFFIAFVGLMTLSGNCHMVFASPSWRGIIHGLVFYLLVACGEETIFRGILFRMFDERFGLWWALVVSALLFGLIHIIQPNASVWSSVAIAVEAGILLGVAYKYSGSLWMPIGIHWTWNFTQGNVFGFPVSGGTKEESILQSTLNGPDLLTGGAFGPEASIISMALGIAISVVLLALHFKKRPGCSFVTPE